MNEFDNIYHTDEYRRFMVQKEENISDLCREERTIPLTSATACGAENMPTEPTTAAHTDAGCFTPRAK